MDQETNKNRITGIESSSSDTGFRIQPSEEKKPPLKHFISAFIIVVLLSLIVVGSFLYLGKYGNPFSKEKSKLNEMAVLDDERLRNKQPDEQDLPADADLMRAIKLFRSGYVKSARAEFDKIVESSKENEVKSFALVYLGIIADEEAKFNQAIDDFRRAVKFFPKNYYAHYNMAMAYKHKGDYREAKEELEIAQRIKPDNSDIATLKGELEFETGDYEGSEDTLKKLAESSKDSKAYYNLGLVYKKEGKLAEAKAVFLKAIESEGSSESVYLSLVELGKLYATQQDYDNAELYMMRALKLKPENAKQAYNLAVIQYSAGKTNEAKKTLDRALNGIMEKPEYYIYVSNLYRKLNDLDSAEAAIRKAKSIAPMHPDIIKSLTDILIEQKKWTEAIDYLRKLVEITTGTIEKSQALYQLGRAYMESGDFENGQKALESAYSLDEVNEDALIALGNLYHMKGESHKTIGLYKKALNINPDNVAILKALGILYFDLHMYNESEDTFKKVLEHPLKKDKDTYFVYNSLGKIYKTKRMYENAIRYFEKSAMSEDASIKFEALMEISDCSLLEDKPAAGVFSKIEKAIALKPDSYEARIMLAKALIKDGSASSRDRAEEEIKTVIDLERKPEVLSKAYTLRGIIYYKQGFYKRAIDDFNAALEYDPSNSEAFQNKGTAAQKLESEL
ncbi:MAG: tetratricopeptide repeat protein [Spirochaetia bacterium]|nr:tetratricopeptide repeat protein [Spirochaetia bacterium]